MRASLLFACAACVGCSLITDVDHLRNGARDGGGDANVDSTLDASDAEGDVSVDARGDAESDAAVVARVFVAGGTTTGTTHPSEVIAADVHGDGTIGAWSTANDMPSNCIGCAVARSGPFVYVVGPDDVDDVPNTVRVAKITGNSLSNWTQGKPLISPRERLAAVATDKFLFVIGGRDPTGKILQDVDYASIASDGTLGTWAKTTPLPVPLNGHAAATARGHIWVVGGNESDGGASSSTVYQATIASDGTIVSWSTVAALPVAPYGPVALVNDSDLYVFGGYTKARAIYYATIDAGGALGGWTSGPTLATQHALFGAAVTSGYIFAFGGFDALNAPSDVIEVSKLAADGTPGDWQTIAPLPTVRTFHVAFASP